MNARFAAVSSAKKLLKSALLAPAMAGRNPEPGLYVLIYHRIGAAMNQEMDLPVARFSAQMAELWAEFEVVVLEDGLARLAADPPLENDLVAVTFDDGYREVYSAAWPALQELRIPATVFVATGFIEGETTAPIRPGAAGSGSPALPLTWDQLGEMTSSGLVAAASHSHTHRDFDKISRDEAEEELTRSADILQSRTGVRPEIFAYPRAIAAHEDAVRRHYKFAVVGDGTKNTAGSFDPMRVGRTPVRASDGMFFFRRKLHGMRPLEDRAYSMIRASKA